MSILNSLDRISTRTYKIRRLFVKGFKKGKKFTQSAIILVNFNLNAREDFNLEHCLQAHCTKKYQT